ncbi:hypothetical protein FDP41_000012 [Naegleria fowleri]|uniref:Uncharacterized protein n=1 Tax=Naegleria fowleri TaxID=5763 RepID=A0A6A5C3J1_NAEFO|nr:uncharacterized protein FDP41_000012 [Naegleria fowleri]KAF0984973.1 hypothetical protein FDP41_000012 [Naegleria fowleri]
MIATTTTTTSNNNNNDDTNNDEDMDTNLNVLQQASSILDEELEELGDGPFGKLSLEQLAKTDHSVFMMMDGLNSGFSSFVQTPREKSPSSESEEEVIKMESGQLFDKAILMKAENETNFQPLQLQDIQLFRRYVTQSGNIIERVGSESVQINNNKVIHLPVAPTSHHNNGSNRHDELNNNNPSNNNYETRNTSQEMTKNSRDNSSMIVDEASLIPSFTERKSVAHNIRLLAASKLLNELPDEDEECSDEWLVSPRSKPIGNSLVESVTLQQQQQQQQSVTTIKPTRSASQPLTSSIVTSSIISSSNTTTQHPSHQNNKTSLMNGQISSKEVTINSNHKSHHLHQEHHENVSTSFSSSSEASSSISEDENDEEFHVDDTLSDKGVSTRKSNDAKAKYKTISSLPSTSSGSLASKIQNSSTTTPKNTFSTIRKTQQKASDSASSSKSFRDATGYKPQFFNPPEDVKCKEPSEQKKQQWENKKKPGHSSNNSNNQKSSKKSTARDIPNSTIYPPPQPHVSPKRPIMNHSLIELPAKTATSEKAATSHPTSSNGLQVKKPVPNLFLNNSHIGNSHDTMNSTTSTLSKKKEANTQKPPSRATTPTFSHVSHSLELNNNLYDDHFDALESSLCGGDTFSEVSNEETPELDEFEFDELTVNSAADFVTSKSWKLMRWRRDNLREKNFSSSLKKLTANRNSKSQVELPKIPGGQDELQKDQSYESCIIARDIANELVDRSIQAMEQKPQIMEFQEVTVSLFGSIVLSKTVEDMLSHALLSSTNSHQHLAKVSISFFSSSSGKIPDYVENNIPCFIELFKVAKNNSNSSPNSIKAYYSTFVNIPNNIPSLVNNKTNQLVGTFYYDIDVLAQEVKINLTNKACYQWKGVSTIYFPFEKSEKIEGDSSSLNSSLTTFFKLKRAGDTRIDSEIPHFLNSKTNKDSTNNKGQPKGRPGESNIFAVNLNTSESMMIESPLPVNKSLYNTTLHSEDIQLSPVFVPTSPVQPHHQIERGKAVRDTNERQPKCCFM